MRCEMSETVAHLQQSCRPARRRPNACAEWKHCRQGRFRARGAPPASQPPAARMPPHVSQPAERDRDKACPLPAMSVTRGGVPRPPFRARGRGGFFCEAAAGSGPTTRTGRVGRRKSRCRARRLEMDPGAGDWGRPESFVAASRGLAIPQPASQLSQLTGCDDGAETGDKA